MRDIIRGFQNHYPLCCIIRFSFSNSYQAVKRGGVHSDQRVWVACGIFHEPDHIWTIKEKARYLKQI